MDWTIEGTADVATGAAEEELEEGLNEDEALEDATDDEDATEDLEEATDNDADIVEATTEDADERMDDTDEAVEGDVDLALTELAIAELEGKRTDDADNLTELAENAIDDADARTGADAEAEAEAGALACDLVYKLSAFEPPPTKSMSTATHRMSESLQYCKELAWQVMLQAP